MGTDKKKGVKDQRTTKKRRKGRYRTRKRRRRNMENRKEGGGTKFRKCVCFKDV